MDIYSPFYLSLVNEVTHLVSNGFKSGFIPKEHREMDLRVALSQNITGKCRNLTQIGETKISMFGSKSVV
jgi:hypothetical protein